LIQRCTQSILASSIGALLFLSSENLINIHSWVMSEGLFICLMLVLVLMLLLFIEKYNRFYLIASGIALTLLILTRYVGLGFIAAAGFVILISNRGNWKHQLKNILIFGTISILPVVLWFIRNSRLSGDVANRDFGLFPITRSWIIAYANQWTTWLFPSEFQLPWRPRLVLTFLLTIIILIGFVLHEYRLVLTKKMRGLSTHSLLPGIVFLCIGTYLIFFISSLFFLGGGNLPEISFARSVIFHYISNLRSVLKNFLRPSSQSCISN
jgi:4-amino-4-deoxy-L-arabinose transferase-like glycosyltransferase